MTSLFSVAVLTLCFSFVACPPITRVENSSVSGGTTQQTKQGTTQSTVLESPPIIEDSAAAPTLPHLVFEPPVLVTEPDSTGFVTKMIYIRNTGSQRLVMESAKGSCGCAGATIQRNNIGPDSTGKIYVFVNTKAFTDTVSNVDFTVKSNADNSEAVFRIVVRKPEKKP